MTTVPDDEDARRIRRALENAQYPPLPEPAYSDDLTEADIVPLKNFLAARLRELKARLPNDSEEQFAVHVLIQVVLSNAMRLTDGLNTWQRMVAAGRGEDPGWVQAMRKDLGDSYNQLVCITCPWRDHPDFAPHWRPRHYLNPAHRAALWGRAATLPPTPTPDVAQELPARQKGAEVFRLDQAGSGAGGRGPGGGAAGVRAGSRATVVRAASRAPTTLTHS
ncbi:hypothetical protein [Streptomyces sp. CA-132043]|uniref:hypothetical protein n=1 Tax=Streptomyces sp. CA-132043 TaxID=3240048 RepID=UPI003D90E6F7